MQIDIGISLSLLNVVSHATCRAERSDQENGANGETESGQRANVVN